MQVLFFSFYWIISLPWTIYRQPLPHPMVIFFTKRKASSLLWGILFFRPSHFFEMPLCVNASYFLLLNLETGYTQYCYLWREPPKGAFSMDTFGVDVKLLYSSLQGFVFKDIFNLTLCQRVQRWYFSRWNSLTLSQFSNTIRSHHRLLSTIHHLPPHDLVFPSFCQNGAQFCVGISAAHTVRSGTVDVLLP